MKIKYIVGQLILFCVILLAGGVQKSFAKTTNETTKIVADSDVDGVDDAVDLCPETPIGTTVNAHGCPVSLAACDYNTKDVSFQLVSSAPVGKITQYLLVDAADGKIAQISSTPAFTNIAGTKTYMVVSFSYENDGTATGLNVGGALSQVTAACRDFSNALMVKICSPIVPPVACDYTTPTVSLNVSGAVPANTKYVLTNTAGTILQIQNTPTFTGLSGTQNYNAYALSYTNDGSLANLTVGNAYSQITANCFDSSNPFPMKVCVCKPNICLVMEVTKTK